MVQTNGRITLETITEKVISSYKAVANGIQTQLTFAILELHCSLQQQANKTNIQKNKKRKKNVGEPGGKKGATISKCTEVITVLYIHMI